MDRYSLSLLTADEAAELLATRRLASAQIGGFVKRSDLSAAAKNLGESAKGIWGNVQNAAKDVWNASPDIEGARLGTRKLPGGGSTPYNMSNYWTDTAKESIRNALIGGGIGGGIGALRGAIGGDGILSGMLSGGLAGAGIGAAGTGLYRAAPAMFGPSPTQVQSDAAAKAEQQQFDDKTKQLTGQGASGRPGHYTETTPHAFNALLRGQPGDAGDLMMAGGRRGIVGRMLKGEGALGEGDNDAFGTLEGAGVGGLGGYSLGKLIQRGGIQNVIADPKMRSELGLSTELTDAQKATARQQSRAARAADPRMKQIGNQLAAINRQMRAARGNKAQMAKLKTDLAAAQKALEARRKALEVTPKTQAQHAAQVKPTQFWKPWQHNLSYSRQLGGTATPAQRARIRGNMSKWRQRAPGALAILGALAGASYGSGDSADYGFNPSAPWR